MCKVPFPRKIAFMGSGVRASLGGHYSASTLCAFQFPVVGHCYLSLEALGVEEDARGDAHGSDV